MNSLSWFLYLAEVVGRVQGFALFLSFISAFASLFYLFAYGCFKAGEKDAEAIVKTIWFVPWVFVVSVFFSLSLLQISRLSTSSLALKQEKLSSPLKRGEKFLTM